MDDTKHQALPPDVIPLPGYVIDLACEQLRTEDGVECNLRPQAFAVLKYLAQRAGHLVTKNELLGAVWHEMTVTDDSLVQAVSDIRRALNDCEHRLVKTVPRRGYILLANTHGMHGTQGAQGAQETSPARPPPDRRRLPQPPHRVIWRRVYTSVSARKK